mmetsp:Transcript_29188/g.32414  ORF Transcript_29188/g.32414 Transcript_29188/m.32414 type:complete len:626 (+) Transcript_29188:32-1909(+)
MSKTASIQPLYTEDDELISMDDDNISELSEESDTPDGFCAKYWRIALFGVVAVILLGLILVIVIFNAQPSSNEKQPFKDDFDYVVVGAGASGSIIAARLAEKHSVLLLEAGEQAQTLLGGSEEQVLFGPCLVDCEEEIVPFSIFDVPFYWQSIATKPQFFWNYTVNLFGTEYINSAAKIVGGTADTNGMKFVRPRPNDFTGEDIPEGWSWGELLPYYRKIEKVDVPNLPNSTLYRGYDGKITVSQPPLANGINEFMQTLISTAQTLGISVFPDSNNPAFTEGLSSVQYNIENGIRKSSALGYLNNAPEELRLRTGAKVIKVEFDLTNNVEGVVYEQNGVEYTAKVANEVIISAGALNSPKILMDSGIGNLTTLTNLGINVIQDSPLVGASVIDQFNIRMEFDLNDNAPIPELFVDFQEQLDMYKSTREGVMGQPSLASPKPIFVWSSANTPLSPDFTIEAYPTAIDGRSKAVFILHLQHTATRGHFVLSKLGDDETTVSVSFDTLDDADATAFQSAVDYVRTIVNAVPFTDYGAIETIPGANVNGTALLDFIKANVQADQHFTGTVPLGTSASGAVDNEFKVRGVNGVRVADCSVLPKPIHGAPMATCFMIGEKASELILASHVQ